MEPWGWEQGYRYPLPPQVQRDMEKNNYAEWSRLTNMSCDIS